MANNNSLAEEQCRLLGMVKLGRNQVDSEALLNHGDLRLAQKVILKFDSPL